MTTASLANFLYNHVKDYLSAGDRPNPSSRGARAGIPPRREQKLVFATVEVPNPAFRIPSRPRRSARSSSSRRRFEDTRRSGGGGRARGALHPELYGARIEGTDTRARFEVTGVAGGQHVRRALRRPPG